MFCYMILFYNGRNFEFVSNFRSRPRFHNILYMPLFKYSLCKISMIYLQKRLLFLKFEKGSTILKLEGGGGLLTNAICAFHKKIRRQLVIRHNNDPFKVSKYRLLFRIDKTLKYDFISITKIVCVLNNIVS